MIGIGGGLSAQVISMLQQLDLIIRVAGGFVALLVGVIVLILQGHKLYCLARVRKWFGLSIVIAALTAYSGCSAVPVRIPIMSPAAVSVLTAATSNAKAIASSAAAQERISSARAKASQLSVSAAPEQRAIIHELSDSLDAANVEIVHTQTNLRATDEALTQSAKRVDALQGQLSDSADALSIEQTAHKKAIAGRDFWRSVTWKLALLSLALGLWTFRKPIRALFGVPAIPAL